ncbi:rhodanese-like domain-containing protein [Halovulum sp. GXIMD14793]
MSGSVISQVGSCSPVEAWEILKQDKSAILVDVRSRPEWSFVGVPDLSSLGKTVVLTEWRAFPDMQVNAGFVDQMFADQSEAPSQILFICRSGARSLDAAQTVSAALAERGEDVACSNVDQGFEGDLDADRHRATVNGWKHAGLPWQQG